VLDGLKKYFYPCMRKCWSRDLEMPQERSPVMVLILGIITLGIYLIYWLYQAFKQVLEDSDSSPVLWLIGMLVPLLNVVIIWKFSMTVEEYSGGETDGILIFILYLVFAPAAIYIIQRDLNTGLEKRQQAAMDDDSGEQETPEQ